MKNIKIRIVHDWMGNMIVTPIAEKYKEMEFFLQFEIHQEQFFQDFNLSERNKRDLNNGWHIVILADYEMVYHYAMNNGSEEFFNKETFK